MSRVFALLLAVVLAALPARAAGLLINSYAFAAPAPSGTPVDAILDFEGVAAATVVSDTLLAAQDRGTGSWRGRNASGTLSTLTTATIVEVDEVTRHVAYTCAGETFASFTRAIRFDLTGREEGDGGWEQIEYLFPASKSSVVAGGTFRIETNSDPALADNLSIDYVTVYTDGGAYIAGQQQMAPGTSAPSAGTGYAHRNGSLGATSPLTRGIWYDWEVQPEVASSRGRIIIRNAITGALVATSIVTETYGDAVNALWGTYLTAFDGDYIEMTHLRVRHETPILPIDAGYALDPVASVGIVQTLADQVRLEWASNALQFRVRYRADGGAWTELVAAQDRTSVATQTYTHGSLSQDVAYEWEVTALAFGHTAAATLTAAYTLNEVPAGYTLVQQTTGPSSDQALGYYVGFSSNYRQAAKFVAAETTTLRRIDLRLIRNGSLGVTQKIAVAVFSHDGGANDPVAIVSSGVISWEVDSGSQSTSAAWVSFEGCSLPITSGTTYWVVPISDVNTTSSQMEWLAQELASVQGSAPHKKIQNAGGAWQNNSIANLFEGMFRLYKATP